MNEHEWASISSHPIFAVKELAIYAVRPSAIVVECCEQHGDEYALVNSKIRLGSRETEVERSRQRHRTLSCFFLQVRQNSRLACRPGNQPVRPNTNDADVELVAVFFDHELCNPLRFPVGIH